MSHAVRELWRYPVKSMMGERLDALTLGATGVAGDRAWAVRDEADGAIRGAKRLPELMRCAARYPQAPPAGSSRPAEITLPDGTQVTTGDEDVHARLSAVVGRDVTLWPLVPAGMREHYRRGAPAHADLETELRSIFGRTDEEPLPDLSGLPSELMEFESLPGTYFDALPILVIASSSLERLQRARPESHFDVRRFRPNLVIDTDGADGWIERDWVGRELGIGEVVLSAEASCPRCVMTTHGFDDLPKDSGVMRTLVQENQGDLGVYCSVKVSGRIRCGDALEVV